MFEKATRQKLRFATSTGQQLTVEDLWDLPLTATGKKLSLDELAKSLNRELKETAEESFVVKKSSTNTTLELKFELVKHIIQVKMDEKESHAKDVARRQERQRLMELIEKKENESLENLSLEELHKRLAEV